MSGVCWSNSGVPLKGECSSPSSVQLHALPLSGCLAMLSQPVGQNFQVFFFFTSGGKRKTWGRLAPAFWAATVTPQGKHQPAIVRLYKLSKSSNIVKVKTSNWTNYKNKNYGRLRKFKVICTSSLLWSWVKKSAKISGRTKSSDHLFTELLQIKNKSSCRKHQQLKL